jgi:4-amino-4-deoxy-L-arabinose transferase-like glycosyltransferase
MFSLKPTEIERVRPLSGAARPCLFFGFLFCIWLTTLVSIVSVPLETHEIFVIETAREMRETGDWILPRFNGAPRLMKPPLSYWATAGLSKLDPFSPDVQPWHGRMISLLSGLLMVWVTFRMGKTLYGERTGLVAATLLMSTQGFIHLSNSARPDFLYAALGVLQLHLWIEAWRAKDGTWGQLVFSLAGWTVAAVATLTKGPQLSLLLLLGLTVFLIQNKERKRMAGILRPLSGAALFCLIVLPWWVLLNRRLGILGIALSDTQLSGSLLHNQVEWRELLTVYYLRTLFVLLLPLGLAVPFMVPQLWKNRGGGCEATRLLFYIAGTLLVVFTLWGHYRKHYLLPVLPVFALFFARAIETLPFPPLRGRGLKILIAVLALAALGGSALIVYRQAYGILLYLLPVLLVLPLVLKNALADPGWRKNPLAAQTFVTAGLTVVIVSVANALLPMTQWRMEEQTFSAAVGRSLGPDDRIVELKTTVAVLPYYAKRRVEHFTELSKLRDCLSASIGRSEVFVVFPATELETFSAFYESATIHRTRYFRAKKSDLVCVKIRGVKAVQEPDAAAPLLGCGGGGVH